METGNRVSATPVKKELFAEQKRIEGEVKKLVEKSISLEDVRKGVYKIARDGKLNTNWIILIAEMKNYDS